MSRGRRSLAKPSARARGRACGGVRLVAALLLTAAGIALLTTQPAAARRTAPDLARYVNPFTGTASGAPDFGTGGGAGNTFPGALVPFGMLQWSPDTLPGTDNFAGGYSYADARLRGFSLTHVSGAGCAAYQDVPFLPTTQPVTAAPSVFGSSDIPERYVPRFAHEHERAEPGYYGVRLDPGGERQIDAALTATTRSGIGRFSFPATSSASMLINAGGSAMANRDVKVRIDPSRREVTGSVSSGLFCYQRNRYELYFAAEFSRPFAAHGTWEEQTLRPGSISASNSSDYAFNYKPIPGGPPSLPGNPSGTAQAGAYVTFDASGDRSVEVRVAISYVSVDNARANLAAEQSGFRFDHVRDGARAAWNRALDSIRVSGGAEADRRTFYTMLYHALIAPSVFSDANGQYMGMDGRVHDAAGRVRYGTFSGWDVYRSQFPLLAMLAPRRASDMAQTLVASAAESGCLPKWSLANGHTDVMVGDPADPLIASAHALGARGFDAPAALRAMLKGGREDCRSPNGDYVQRQALRDYLQLGYVPHDGTETSSGASTSFLGDTENVWGSAATTLEYTTADFAIAQLAAALGDPAVHAEFMRRSGAWRNLLNPETRHIHPRYRVGLFRPAFSPGSGEGFAEGNASQYTWMVPYDPAGLFEALGGRSAAADRLGRFFTELNAGPESEHAFLGNEPSLGVPWLYDWLGQPHETQRVVRRAIRELYEASPGGYPGNDDAGQMSSWYVFGALGFYPAVPGTDLLALASPLFPAARVRLAGGDLVITGSGAALGAPYVQRLALNGRPHEAPWLRFADVACGGRLRFRLGSVPNLGWGSRPELAPPSYPPTSSPTAVRRSPCPPVISRLRVTPVRVRAGRVLPRRVRRTQGRPVIRFRLSEDARTTIAFARLLPGRQVGRRCLARRPKLGRSCRRAIRVRPRLRVRARRGKNLVRFTGRLTRRRALRPGRYRLTAVARGRGGARSRPAHTRFVLLR